MTDDVILVPGKPAAHYHSDHNLPEGVPRPTFSASMMTRLLEHSAHGLMHDLQNPPEQPTEAMLGGSAAHAFILSDDPHKSLAVIDAKNWQGGDAKKARDEALEAGRIPILKETTNKNTIDIARLEKMRKSWLKHALNRKISMIEYDVEATIYWCCEGIWKRCRHDLLPSREALLQGVGILDYKTTGKNFRRWGADYLYGGNGLLRILHYTESIVKLHGILPNVWYVVQESVPPYSVQHAMFNIGSFYPRYCELKGIDCPFECPPLTNADSVAAEFILRVGDLFMLGDKIADIALAQWRHALETNEWPDVFPFTNLSIPANYEDRLKWQYPNAFQGR